MNRRKQILRQRGGEVAKAGRMFFEALFSPDPGAFFNEKGKASPRMSRTEAFLHYAEENPDEVLAAVDDKTDALIRELEAQHRDAHRSLRRPPRARHTPEQQLAEVPF